MQRVSNAEGHSESKPSCMTQPAHVYTSADDAGSMPRCGRAAKLERRMFLRRRGCRCATRAHISQGVDVTELSFATVCCNSAQCSANRTPQSMHVVHVYLLDCTHTAVPNTPAVCRDLELRWVPPTCRGNPVALAPHAQRLSWTLKPPRSLHSRQDGLAAP